MTKTQEYLSHNIKTARKNKKLTQADLAELCDVSVNYIALIETSKRFPYVEVLEKIAHSLDLEVYELFLKPNFVVSKTMTAKEKFMNDVALLVEKLDIE